MTDQNAVADRARDKMKGEFLGPTDRNNFPSNEERIASALEYIANHIGAIDNKLSLINANLAKLASKA